MPATADQPAANGAPTSSKDQGLVKGRAPATSIPAITNPAMTSAQPPVKNKATSHLLIFFPFLFLGFFPAARALVIQNRDGAEDAAVETDEPAFGRYAGARG